MTRFCWQISIPSILLAEVRAANGINFKRPVCCVQRSGLMRNWLSFTRLKTNSEKITHTCTIMVALDSCHPANNGTEWPLGNPCARFYPYHSPQIWVTCNMSQRLLPIICQGYINYESIHLGAVMGA